MRALFDLLVEMKEVGFKKCVVIILVLFHYFQFRTFIAKINFKVMCLELTFVNAGDCCVGMGW